MNNFEYIFSFVIPHKNSPDLLKRCLDSIPVRKDIQVIVVDDNSSTDFFDINAVRQYRDGDYEVYVINDNKGAGRARNEGLRRAKGKWILFADADDYYTDQLPSFLDRYSDVDDVDIVYFCCNGLDEYNCWIRQYADGDTSLDKRIRFNSWVPWNKMIRTDLIHKHGIFFEEIKSGNDAKFSLLNSYYAESVRVDTNILYTYSPNNYGITLKKKSLDDIIEVIPYKLEILNFLEEVNARYPRYKKNVKPNIYIIRQYGIWGYFKYLLNYYRFKIMKPTYVELSRGVSR